MRFSVGRKATVDTAMNSSESHIGNDAASANPFQCGRPIDSPSGFFGRARELNRLGAHLHQLNWVSVVGPQGIGKTSLLLQLRIPAVAAKLGLPPPDFVVSYVDAQGLGYQSATDWYRHIVRGVARELGVSPAPQVHNGVEFCESLRCLLADERKLVLILDEFEEMATSEHLTSDFFKVLRSLSAGYPVALITASRKSLADLVRQPNNALSSPFFDAFNTLRVGLLDPLSARALLDRPEAGFASNLIKFLLELAGPHPCFLQLAGQRAFEHKLDGPMEGQILSQLREDLREAVSSRLEYAWKYLSPEARYRLVALAWTPMDEPGLKELQEACLVQGGEALSPLVEDFARRQTLPDVLQLGSLVVDLRQQQVTWRGEVLSITGLPFEVLCYLMRHPGEPVHWLQLEKAVWGRVEELPNDYQGNQERTDAAVKRLRLAFREVRADSLISYRSGTYRLAPVR